MANVRETRDKFIEEGTRVLLHRLASAVGEKEGQLDIGKMNDTNHDEIVRDMMDIIKRMDDREKIAVESTAKIIEGMAEGKLSINDAEKLMRILHVKMEIEEVPRMAEAMEQLASSDK